MPNRRLCSRFSGLRAPHVQARGAPLDPDVTSARQATPRGRRPRSLDRPSHRREIRCARSRGPRCSDSGGLQAATRLEGPGTLYRALLLKRPRTLHSPPQPRGGSRARPHRTRIQPADPRGSAGLTVSDQVFRLERLRSRALKVTIRVLALIKSAAHSGRSRMPRLGYRAPAATGMASRL